MFPDDLSGSYDYGFSCFRRFFKYIRLIFESDMFFKFFALYDYRYMYLSISMKTIK